MNTTTCPMCGKRLNWTLTEEQTDDLKEGKQEIVTLAKCPDGHFDISIHRSALGLPTEYADWPF